MPRPKKALPVPVDIQLSKVPAHFDTSDILKLVKPDLDNDIGYLTDRIVESYYGERGSLPRTCRTLGLSYRAVAKLRKDHEGLREALKAVDEILADEVHQQFLDHVYDRDDKNPAWKIFYLKKNDPKYADRPPGDKPIQINLQFNDTTLRPTKVIDVKSID